MCVCVEGRERQEQDTESGHRVRTGAYDGRLRRVRRYGYARTACHHAGPVADIKCLGVASEDGYHRTRLTHTHTHMSHGGGALARSKLITITAKSELGRAYGRERVNEGAKE